MRERYPHCHPRYPTIPATIPALRTTIEPYLDDEHSPECVLGRSACEFRESNTLNDANVCRRQRDRRSRRCHRSSGLSQVSRLRPLLHLSQKIGYLQQVYIESARSKRSFLPGRSACEFRESITAASIKSQTGTAGECLRLQSRRRACSLCASVPSFSYAHATTAPPPELEPLNGAHRSPTVESADDG